MLRLRFRTPIMTLPPCVRVVSIMFLLVAGAASARGAATKLDEGLGQAKNFVPVFVRMEDQLLGRAGDYESFCAGQPATVRRLELRQQVIQVLHEKADTSFARVQKTVEALTKAGQIRRTKRYWIVNGFAGEATAEACRALAELPAVGFVYRQRGAAQHAPARRRTSKPDPDQVKLYRQLLKIRHDDTADPFDPSKFEIPWNLKRVGADRAWTQHQVFGRGIVVAVLDSGLMAMPALTRSLWKNPDETLNGKDDDGNGYVDDVFGYDFQRQSPYVVSASRPSHGTLCAGIIAGRPDGPEDRIVTGIAPRAQIMPLVGNGRLSAYEYALAEGADILSMSYTLDAQNLGHYRGLYRTAHEHLAAAGVVSVGGAGNYARQRPEGWQIGTPKDIPCVIAVAGITLDGKITAASSRGPVSWTGVRYYDPDAQNVPAPPSKPDVTACFGGYPMWTLVSVWEGRKKDRLKVVYEDRQGYVLATGPQGNSFSGPHAAGVAALMLEANPQLPVWHLQRLMEDSGKDLGDPGRDTTYGAGLLQADQAVAAVRAFGE